jgi:hypothetical protein
MRVCVSTHGVAFAFARRQEDGSEYSTLGIGCAQIRPIGRFTDMGAGTPSSSACVASSNASVSVF